MSLKLAQDWRLLESLSMRPIPSIAIYSLYCQQWRPFPMLYCMYVSRHSCHWLPLYCHHVTFVNPLILSLPCTLRTESATRWYTAYPGYPQLPDLFFEFCRMSISAIAKTVLRVLHHHLRALNLDKVCPPGTTLIVLVTWQTLQLSCILPCSISGLYDESGFKTCVRPTSSKKFPWVCVPFRNCPISRTVHVQLSDSLHARWLLTFHCSIAADSHCCRVTSSGHTAAGEASWTLHKMQQSSSWASCW